MAEQDLTYLPQFPPNYLSCAGKELTTLPTLPFTLTNLECSHTQLTILPTLPSSLQYLECSSNQLTTLPILPSTLSRLYCNPNPYNTIFKDLISVPHDMLRVVRKIRGYYAKINNQLRNTLAFQKTLMYNCRINDNCLNIIGSYLSGQTGTLIEQITELQTILQ